MAEASFFRRPFSGPPAVFKSDAAIAARTVAYRLDALTAILVRDNSVCKIISLIAIITFVLQGILPRAIRDCRHIVASCIDKIDNPPIMRGSHGRLCECGGSRGQGGAGREPKTAHETFAVGFRR